MLRHFQEFYPLAARISAVFGWIVLSTILALFVVWAMIFVHVVKRERDRK